MYCGNESTIPASPFACASGAPVTAVISCGRGPACGIPAPPRPSNWRSCTRSGGNTSCTFATSSINCATPRCCRVARSARVPKRSPRSCWPARSWRSTARRLRATTSPPCGSVFRNCCRRPGRVVHRGVWRRRGERTPNVDHIEARLRIPAPVPHPRPSVAVVSAQSAAADQALATPDAPQIGRGTVPCGDPMERRSGMSEWHCLSAGATRRTGGPCCEARSSGKSAGMSLSNLHDDVICEPPRTICEIHERAVTKDIAPPITFLRESIFQRDRLNTNRF